MSLWLLTFQQDRQRFKRYFSYNRLAKTITVSLFLAAFLAMGVLLYVLLAQGLSYFVQDEAVSLYLEELFAGVLFFLIMGSGFIAALFGMFSRSQAEWILVAPRHRFLFWYQLYKSLISSLWPIVLLVVPALFALRSILHYGVGQLLAVAAAVVLLTGVAVLAGTVIIGSLAAALQAWNRLEWPYLLRASVGTGVAAVVAMLAWVRHSHVPSLILAVPEPAPSVIADRFSYAPSHFAAIVLNAGAGSRADQLLALTILALLCLNLLLLCQLIADSYLGYWQRLQEGGRRSAPSLRSSSSLLLGWLAKVRTPQQALLAKELTLFVRDRQNLVWLGFLGSLWLLETFLTVSSLYEGRALGLSALSSSYVPLQFLVSLYFTAVLVLRFVFPSYSLEGQAAWVLASAPLDAVRIFYSKLLFYTVLLAGLGLIIFSVGLSLLRIGAGTGLSIVGLLVAAMVTLVVIGQLFSVLFPDFSLSDPQALSTSSPGLALVFVSLVYGGVATLAMNRVLDHGSGILPVLFLVGSILIVLIGLVAAPQAVRRLEASRVLS